MPIELTFENLSQEFVVRLQLVKSRLCSDFIQKNKTVSYHEVEILTSRLCSNFVKYSRVFFKKSGVLRDGDSQKLATYPG